MTNKGTLIYASLIMFLQFFVSNLSVKGQEINTGMKDIEGFKINMKKASESTMSISSDFIQLKHLSFLEEDVKSEGVFYFEKDNKLRWEYASPFYYLIIFKGDSIMIRDDNKTNIYDAASGRMFKEINQIMVEMVNGSMLESKNFEISFFENPSSFILELFPIDENMKEFLSKIIIHINRENYTADELYMLERSEDYTHIQFINKRLNESIPKHIFDLP